MKIYFDGCAKTLGADKNEICERWSTKLCQELKADEYNISKSGSSNRRLCRNLFEHNLSEFDLFIIQMTKAKRWEYFDKETSEWCNVTEHKNNPHDNPKFYFDYVNSNPTVENWKDVYWREIYTDEQGQVDQKICYTCIKSLLRDHKHIILYVGANEPNFSCDLKYVRGVDYEQGTWKVSKQDRFQGGVGRHLYWRDRVSTSGGTLHDKILEDVLSLLTRHK